MNNRFRNKLETRKYRLKRHGKHILRDIYKAVLLVAVIFTITAGMIHAYQYAVTSPYFHIRETIVRGCKELTEKDILTLAAIKPTQSLLTINSDALTGRIASNSWVKEVHIGRELPDRLVIEIRERTAVALVKQDSGFFLLDPEGNLFKKLQNGDETDLPVLSGCYSEGKADTRLLSKSLDLLKFISNLKDFPVINRVSEIHGHEVLGLSLYTDSGLCLQLGFDNYESKLNRLSPVMTDLERRNLKPGFMLIDLSDPAKVTVQMRNIMEPAAPTGSKKGLRT